MKTLRILSIAIFTAACLSLGACASNQPKPYTGERVSNLPHSTPEQWQGAGAFGSMFPNSQ
ncbi:MAG: hypothetical protein AAF585_01370 [Verrucomicrobiota bacterium]